MDKLHLGPIGMAVNTTDGDGYLDEAAEVEKLGYSTLWVSGGQLASLTPIADLVRGTITASVAPGIIPLDLHDATAVTRLYTELESTHPGRFVVGLGAPQRGASPLRATNEFLDELDEANPPVPADRRILAALGPRKLALARERFAGAVTLLVTPDYTRHARATLGPDATLVVTLMVVLDDSVDRARNTARSPMQFLLGVGGYMDNARRMGYTDDDLTRLSDRMVDDLAAVGDAETVAARARQHLEAGADHVALSAFSDGNRPAGVEVARELAEHLLR